MTDSLKETVHAATRDIYRKTRIMVYVEELGLDFSEARLRARQHEGGATP
jgi:hypothetical protein